MKFKDIFNKYIREVQVQNSYKLKISIPIIQRDYAQGRKDAATIRDKFLDEIFNRLDNNENLFLDFVYGSIEDDKFIPIDGQQRLTTLFLLHLYFAKKERKDCEYLKGFTYETRSSSREFCEKLVVEDLDFTKDEISPDIKDSSWFMPFWENDPTVKSMLVMLDAIHDKFKNSNFYDRLENIKFSFLELKEFGLTDDLYIKMNARGKLLSEFENFKAEFEKELPQEIKAKLDNAWLDLFWGLKDGDKEDVDLSSVDKRYMAFFKGVASNFTVLNIKDTKGAKDFDFDEFDTLDTLEFFNSNENNVNNVIKILDELCEVSNYELLKNFTDTSKDITYETRAKFFALSMFLIKFGAKKLGGDFYKEYERITSNVARDFNIDSISNLKQTFEFINEICDKCKSENIFDLLADFQNEQPGSFKVINFYRWQEKKKLELMQSDPRWVDAINKGEKHWYLGSNLTFLIDFAENDVEKFKEYYKKFDEIFKEDRENFFFQRALLAKGDYLPERKDSGYFTFCNFNASAREKDDNWRSVFFDKEKNENLKELLDDDRDLKQIIEDFNDKNYWGYYFIKYPEILKECTNFWIWAYGYTIRVLTGKLTNSYHVEYYTYSLFIMLQKQFQNLSDEKLDYEWVKAYGEIPYVLIDGNKITFIQTNDNKYCWMIDDKQIGEIFDPCLPDRDVLPPIVDKVYEIARSIL
ncbi:GmrSD restriction endonuclease domain-containing protein [Campylobacter concisus]|uniref:GmrSD restriction endonuclease domain-containing protein n=1 Tax=Campylobacter concisus TaxID=199 RepID=UPI000CD90BC4|nr:DUF262 domain-containing protein [Campylobacter concisus]